MLAADRRRGRKRITGERRVPENHVSAWSDAVVVESRVTTTFDVAGHPFTLPISIVSLRLRRPPTAGKHDLVDLDANICERFERGEGAGRETLEECTGASGTIVFRPSDGGFSADVVLEDVSIDDITATLRGSLHLEHQPGVESDICPDIR